MYGFNKTFTIERLTPDLDIYGIVIDGKESYQPLLGDTQIGAITPVQKWLGGQLVASDYPLGILSIENPENTAIVITNYFLDITTPTNGECTADMGIDGDDSILQDIDLSVAGIKDWWNYSQSQSINIKVLAGQSITISKKTGTTAGLVGRYYISYITLPAENLGSLEPLKYNCALQPLGAEDAFLTEGNLAKSHKIFTSEFADIKETDRITIGSQKYIVKGVQLFNKVGRKHKEIIVEEMNS